MSTMTHTFSAAGQSPELTVGASGRMLASINAATATTFTCFAEALIGGLWVRVIANLTDAGGVPMFGDWSNGEASADNMLNQFPPGTRMRFQATTVTGGNIEVALLTG